MGTTVSGIRVPTTGDVFDVPGDMQKTVTDLVAANTAQAVVYGKLTKGLQVQGASVVTTSTGGGDVYLYYPVPFAAPPPVIIVSPGDVTLPIVLMVRPVGTASYAVARVLDMAGATLFNTGPLRINVIAIGTPT